MINIQETTCFLGRAVMLTNGKISFTVTLDVGPRILDFRKNDGFNVLFEDRDDAVKRDVSAVYGAGKTWHIYGGHRLWISPEDDTTYYPDDQKIDYVLTENGIILNIPEWKEIGVKPEISIFFEGENQLKIVHKMCNLRKKRELCLWTLTVLKSGGTLTVPLSDADTGLLPNRNLVLWPYASLADKRLRLKDGSIQLKSDKQVPKPYKFGIFREKIHAEYRLFENGAEATFLKVFRGDPHGRYPDFSCNFESYCSDLIHEVEALSPVLTVEQGESAEFSEEWFLF